MTTGVGVPSGVLAAECDRLLDFGRHVAHPLGGASWLDERATALESMTAFKRAGADLIITYYARDVAGWLRHG